MAHTKLMKLMVGILGGVVISSDGIVFAAGCAEYPLSDGLSVQQTDRGPKIMSTATATVAMDDVDEVLDATKEAELTAKAAISKFFNETIQSDEALNKSVETEIKIVGDNKDVTKNTLKTQMISIRNSSQALLKGVQKIGDCYTKGELVKVTVGLKPETVAAAASGQEMIQGDTGGSSAEDGTGGNLNNMDGYSNTKGISEF